MKYLLLVTLAIFTGWCSGFNETNKEKPLAKVGNQYLYSSELRGLIKPGFSKNDSLVMIASLAEKWIRKQLILQKAELNLTEEEKDVEKELDEYRTSLIIYKYEQKLIKEKLDTAVRQNEIIDYFNKNTSNFILNYDIVKAQYIKLPLKSKNIDKVKEWINSASEDKTKLLEKYCLQHAFKYEYFNDEWINFDNLKMLLPVEISNNEYFLKSNKSVELKDSFSLYLLNINDYKLKGSQSPLKFVDNDIKSILLLKRKQKLLNDLENKIYFDAIDRNNFTIYKNR
jgi:hypothetical protein